MSTEDKILSLIRSKGPVLPVDVARAIESNILLASAHLSELVSRDKLKVSKTKVGGSPVYYLKEQAGKLQDFSKNLNNKEQRVYSLIKEKKILKDSDLEPSVRVMIRNIKDFAVPIQIKIKENKTLFWKWYLLTDDEVNKEVSKFLNPKKEEMDKEPEKKQTENKEEKKKLDDNSAIEKEKKKLEAEKEKIRKELEKEKQKIQREFELEKTKLKKDLEEKNKIENEKKKLEAERKKLEQERLNLQKQTEQKKLEVQNQEEKPNLNNQTDIFSNKIKSYFSESRIEVFENNILRKGKEIDMLLKIPSVVGHIDYYCKAKDKKKINDGDLSSAFIQGQLKRMPVLFLTTGDLTKKAKEMVEKELKGIVVKKI